MPVIDVKATGTNIKNIIKSKGFKISDVQARCGFNAFVNKKLSHSAMKCYTERAVDKHPKIW